VLKHSCVLFFSRPRSKGWPHHGRTFSIYLGPLCTEQNWHWHQEQCKMYTHNQHLMTRKIFKMRWNTATVVPYNIFTWHFPNFLLNPQYFPISSRIGNESVPKNTINDMIKFFPETSISILVISNHNSFRVLFAKIASVYFIWKIY